MTRPAPAPSLADELATPLTARERALGGCSPLTRARTAFLSGGIVVHWPVESMPVPPPAPVVCGACLGAGKHSPRPRTVTSGVKGRVSVTVPTSITCWACKGTGYRRRGGSR